MKISMLFLLIVATVAANVITKDASIDQRQPNTALGMSNFTAFGVKTWIFGILSVQSNLFELDLSQITIPSGQSIDTAELWLKFAASGKGE